MMPVIEADGGGVFVLTRGLADAALLSSFGALLFAAWLAPPVLAGLGRDAPGMKRRLDGVAGGSIVAALLLTATWLLLQAVRLSGSWADAPAVLWTTLFGHVVAARFVLLAGAGLALGWGRRWFAAALAAAAAATQAGHGHALAMTGGPSWLLLSGVVHLLAAGAWLGGLVPLLLLIRAAPPDAARRASSRFAPLGTACVAVLAGTALFQGGALIGSLPRLIGTGYGWVALIKVALFASLIGLAARNRFRLTPALAGTAPVLAKRALVRTIAAEAGAGLAVVLAAGLLTSLEPAMHVQPIWPFDSRVSFDAVRDDADFRREVVTAASAAFAVLVATAAAFLLRSRVRWPLVAASIIVVIFATPHFGLLLAEAYPTYYWRSPTGFSSVSIAGGAALFPGRCASCHGAEGHGDGPLAKGLPVPPADLTAEHLWAHTDGELFWWLTHGVAAPRGGLAMPGFAEALSEDQRWALIDYVRAHNAGVASGGMGMWPRPTRAPGLSATCPDGRAVTLNDFAGRVVRLVFGAAVDAAGAATIQTAPSATICVADDAAVARAYAVVTGMPVAALTGQEVLIDGDGWLRSIGPVGDATTLAEAMRAIAGHPLAPAAPVSMVGMKM